MKKTLTMTATLILLLVCPRPATALEVDDLITRVIQAQGGRSLLEGITSVISEGRIVLVAQGGVEGRMVIRSKDPDLTMSEMEFMGMKIVQSFDGERAWADNPMAGGVMELTGIDARNMKRNAIGNEALLNPGEHGITYTMEGTEKVGEAECYVVEQVYPDGQTSRLFYDRDTFRLVKSASRVETSQGSFDNELLYSDYQVTDGITSARKITIFRNGQEFLRMIIDRITYNPPIEDGVFTLKKPTSD